MIPQNTERLKTFLFVTVLTMAGILVHGYHPGAEDDAIYLPAIKRNLDPSLFPTDALFFLEQTRLTLFDELIALFVRTTRLPLDVAAFLLHVLSIFLVLLACLQISRRCFLKEEARRAAVMTVTALLTLPVSGTALLIMDYHLHPRSIATAAILFAVVAVLDKRHSIASLLMVLAAVIHPLMATFGAIFCLFLGWRPRREPETLAPGVLSAALAVDVDSAIWEEIRQNRRHHYLVQWTWYEWLGIVAPLVLLFSMSTVPLKGTTPALAHLSRRVALFGLSFLAVALVTTLPTELSRLGPYQPMRSLHLVYLIFFMLIGGLMGQFVLKRRFVRWVLFLAPLCLVMTLAQRNSFSSTEHIVWPGTSSRNHWVQAFEWVRLNTPRDALFALDPHHMRFRGQDFHGFRAIAERSMLADLVKDPGVVAESFALQAVKNNWDKAPPRIAEDWYRQTRALQGFENFGLDDFRRLGNEFGVTWVMVQGRNIEGLTCPYRNDAVAVCRLDE